jgi:hypothetical protein
VNIDSFFTHIIILLKKDNPVDEKTLVIPVQLGRELRASVSEKIKDFSLFTTGKNSVFVAETTERDFSINVSYYYSESFGKMLACLRNTFQQVESRSK